MDVFLEICMGIDEANHPGEYSESYDVTGYYQFIDGKLDGKMLMFTCEKEYAFNIVDSHGISYIEGAPRKRFFKKNKPPFCPDRENWSRLHTIRS